jgi:hypothetical protein
LSLLAELVLETVLVQEKERGQEMVLVRVPHNRQP